jgi:hypothetical protein
LSASRLPRPLQPRRPGIELRGRLSKEASWPDRYASSSSSAWGPAARAAGRGPGSPCRRDRPDGQVAPGRQGGRRAGDGDLPDRRRGARGVPVREPGQQPGRVCVLPAHLRRHPKHVRGAGLGGRLPVSGWPGSGERLCAADQRGNNVAEPNRHSPPRSGVARGPWWLHPFGGNASPAVGVPR